METSQEDALSLLRKWQEEKRLVQASVTAGGKTFCMVLGRIERVDSEWIIVDGRSRDRKGERYGLTLAVDDVLGFNFEDARYIPADQPEAAKKAEMYDGFLFFQLEWCMCSIWAIKLPDELP